MTIARTIIIQLISERKIISGHTTNNFKYYLWTYIFSSICRYSYCIWKVNDCSANMILVGFNKHSHTCTLYYCQYEIYCSFNQIPYNHLICIYYSQTLIDLHLSVVVAVDRRRSRARWSYAIWKGSTFILRMLYANNDWWWYPRSGYNLQNNL